MSHSIGLQISLAFGGIKAPKGRWMKFALAGFILFRGRRQIRWVDVLGVHFVCPGEPPGLPAVVASMFESKDVVPLCQLPVKLLTVGIFEKGELRSLEPILHVKDVFEPGADQFFCGLNAPRPVTTEHEKIVGFLENLADLLQEGFVLRQRVARLLPVLVELGREKHVGKIIGLEGMSHKLVLGLGPNVDEVAVRHRVEHVKGFDAFDLLGILTSHCTKRSRPRHGKGKDNQSERSFHRIISLHEAPSDQPASPERDYSLKLEISPS